MHRGQRSLAILFGCALAAFTAGVHDVAQARDGKGKSSLIKVDRAGHKTRAGSARYIVTLEAPSLVQRVVGLERNGDSRLENHAVRGPKGKLNVRSPLAQAELEVMSREFEQFRDQVESALGRSFKPTQRYQYGLNGFSIRLTAKEARRLAKLDGVRDVRLDQLSKPQTDAGPEWIGAGQVWNGVGGLPENRGEGVVIGIIDSGINWSHPAFQDPGEGISGPDDYDHENPYGEQLGLCGEPLQGGIGTVQCNDKLVGVYDFIEDDPETEVVEEFNNGADNGAHGAHTASTAAGSPWGFTFVNSAFIELSGVAPNANLISYRVCYAGDPDDPDDDACTGTAQLAAIDQAIADGVDVINHSLGGSAFDPWVNPLALAFLDAVDAGIFVATSAGNGGPASSTVGRPANAPWMVGVGSATHDRVFGTQLNATSGGGSTPPGILTGASLTDQPLSQRSIVHAKDFGSALCGTGAPQSGADCDENTGVSNPFSPGTFNGEIVVCDRGTYGRIEKGKNLLLAGAGGYVLANTLENGGEETVVDNHCLPATHLRNSDGEELRAWLDSGTGHQASITGLEVLKEPDFADRLSDFSARGPNPAPAADVLKPNLIAPGDLIIAADNETTGILIIGGTSMASPHVAGAAALLKAARPEITPRQIASILELTATDELAVKETGLDADHFDTGSGRPQLLDAVNMPLYLEESKAGFLAADPFEGGEPRDLNLASLTNSDCNGVCTFERSIGSFSSGQTWTVSTSGFPAGVTVTVTPAQFTSSSTQPQQISVEVDLTGAELSGQWVYGKLHLDASQLPTATLPVTVFAGAGEVPEEFAIQTNMASGFQDFPVSGLVALPQATYSTGGFKVADETTVELIEDETWEDPFDGSDGVFTVFYEVPEDALWLHADTPASASEDVDLYVGRDINNDGMASDDEVVCISATFDDIEFCEIFRPSAGSWWILVQNWEDGEDAEPGQGPAQAITLISTVIEADSDSQLTATGPGITEARDEFDVRVSWKDVQAFDGQELFGAVGMSSDDSDIANLGVVPVRLSRDGIQTSDSEALFDGRPQAFALDGNSQHEGLYIDVPAGVDSLQVDVQGDSPEQNDNLDLDLYRVDFDDAFDTAPFLDDLPSGASPEASGSGSSQSGPTVTIDGGAIDPGRYHVVVTNTSGSAAAVTVTAAMSYSGSAVDVFGGLWSPSSRPGINQGFEYTPVGANRAFLWYTYELDGSPAWYIASGPHAEGNVWTVDLLRFTNDGAAQYGTTVGTVSLTMLDDSDAIMNWTLDGVSGSDRHTPLSRSCPENVTPLQNYTGLWYRGSSGLGGASIIANKSTQAHIHYLYDGQGEPRWLLASGGFAADNQLPMLQFSGFCPTCTGSTSSQEVGLLDVSYDDNESGSWTLDYLFAAPATGDTTRSEGIVKLSDELICVQ